MANYSYIGKGTVYLRPYAGGKLRPIGNASKCNIAVESEQKSQMDYQNPGGGKVNQVDRVTAVKPSITMLDWIPENIALAIYGNTTAVTGAAVLAEDHVAYKGGLVVLLHPFPSLVTVKSAATGEPPTATTYVAGEDYEVTSGGILITEDSDIDDLDHIFIDYTYAGQNVVQALTESQQVWTLVLDGLNEADSGNPVFLEIHRVKFTPAGELAFLGDDYGELSVDGEALKDTTKTGTGISQYFKATFKQAA